MAWRLAHSLDVLRSQVDAAYPGRNKSSDGTLGDASHSARQSDHNPDDHGVVRALDLTHDPTHFDAHAFANRLWVYRDERIKYVISNRRIWTPAISREWRPYRGTNPHTQHAHISVVSTALADSGTLWQGVKGLEPVAAQAGEEESMQLIRQYADGALHYFYVADGGALYHAWWPRKEPFGRKTEDLGKLVGLGSTDFDGQPSVVVDDATTNVIHVVCDRTGSNPPAHLFYVPKLGWASD